MDVNVNVEDQTSDENLLNALLQGGENALFHVYGKQRKPKNQKKRVILKAKRTIKRDIFS